MDPDSSRLRVAVTDGLGRPIRAPGLSRWLQSVAPARARGAVSIALVSDSEIRALNRRFRGVNRATDVLAFPSLPQSPKPKAQSRSSVLGDLVIATEVARRQATDAGHSYPTELKVLALHGLLHLLGYDHHAVDDDGRMGRTEARLRRKGGLSAGLIERAGDARARQPRAARSSARVR